MAERQFRILWNREELKIAKQRGLELPRSVPWGFLAPHEAQAKSNHDQTLERLHERGGLGVGEMLCVVKGQRLRERFSGNSEVEKEIGAWLEELKELLRAYEASLDSGRLA